MQKDVILVNPPLKGVHADFEHLGLGYVASALRNNGVTVEIIDAHLNRWNLGRTLEEIKKYTCKVLGISTAFQDYAKQTLAFASELKKSFPDVHLSIGGIYPTFAYAAIMDKYPAIDSVVLGEGEETFAELTKNILSNKGLDDVLGVAYRNGFTVTANEPRPLIRDLDTIPFPARDLLPPVLHKLGYASMVTSRGCYGRCSFCSVVPFYSNFGPKFRMRGTENVLEEIEYLYHQYNVKNIMFNDANFTSSPKRALAIAQELITRNIRINYSIECRANDVEVELFRVLKESGLTRVFIGIESGSQAVLDRLYKDTTVEDNIKALEILADLELYVSMGFIMFDDQTTFEEVSDNLLFLKKAKEIMPKGYLNNASFGASKLLPLAGTEYEKHLIEANSYQGNSLNYNYRIRDSKVDKLFKTAKAIDNLNTRLKQIFNQDNKWEKQWLN